MRGKCLMVQGTGSSVGKSILCAALLRVFRQDGHRVAPFKAQNMALNSFATKEGLEMGRAQVLQAQAAGVEPSARMNPILLKPTGDHVSQVIVNGRPVGVMRAAEYYQKKTSLRETVRAAYAALEADFDFIVIEGAGSPAEINLRENDIVNMAMAEMADAPVLLAGDINLGGVFAWLYGTVMLLTPAERARVEGVIINKFRGDRAILAPGLSMLEERIGIPVVGVMPWLEMDLEDEDSLTERFDRPAGGGEIDVAIVRLPHISNFTDFQALSLQEGARVRYVSGARELEGADIVVLPGTKNTTGDLIDLKNRGLGAAVVRHARRGGLVIGVCGGYQMLGRRLYDPLGVEGGAPETAGLGLLDLDVEFLPDKTTLQASAVVNAPRGWLASLNGLSVAGYEIHAGINRPGPDALPWLALTSREGVDGYMNAEGNVFGSYLHGLFDDGELWRCILARVRAAKGLYAQSGAVLPLAEHRERQLDRLADAARANLDMPKIYAMLRGYAK